MFDGIKNITFLFPVMFYYFIEALVVGIFVTFVWKFFLLNLFGVKITYPEWVAIIWIIRILFFDIFKLIAGLSSMNQREINNDNQYNPN